MTKLLEELTDDEMLTMTTDEIETVIDRECAEQGVRILPPQPEPPPPPAADAKPDIQMWRVGAYYFKTAALANQVADCINRMEPYDSYYLTGSYAYSGPEGVRPLEDLIEPTEARFWSASHYEEHRTALREQAEAQKRFNEARTEYDQCRTARDKVAEDV